MKNLIFGILLFAFLARNAHCDVTNYYHDHSSTDETTEKNANVCVNIRQQSNVNIKEILGVWHANEIIMHTNDVPGVYNYKSCVAFHLSDVTDQMRNYYENNYRRGSTIAPYIGHYQPRQRTPYDETRYLRLIWSEDDDNAEYTFNYTESTPGLWMNIGEQRGTFPSLNQYKHFNGMVQVAKAVRDQLVLTFCGIDMRSFLFTVVLSRSEHGLTGMELRSIRELMKRNRLNTDSVRKVCISSGSTLKASFVFLSLLVLLNFLKKFH